ncbi:MAG: hypothetical protein LBK04_06610 [Clostridiales Family XIII bacterium]|nr:hypothetical protein [Clostridiales Family XIII bacterium]
MEILRLSPGKKIGSCTGQEQRYPSPVLSDHDRHLWRAHVILLFARHSNACKLAPAAIAVFFVKFFITKFGKQKTAAIAMVACFAGYDALRQVQAPETLDSLFILNVIVPIAGVLIRFFSKTEKQMPAIRAELYGAAGAAVVAVITENLNVEIAEEEEKSK